MAETYRSKSAPDVGKTNVFGCSRYFFISSNACCYEGPQTKSLLDPLSALNIGRLRSADFEINLFKTASLPVNFEHLLHF
jgi:hypothetical protein